MGTFMAVQLSEVLTVFFFCFFALYGCNCFLEKLFVSGFYSV